VAGKMKKNNNLKGNRNEIANKIVNTVNKNNLNTNNENKNKMN
jgi:hypothetical protein